MPNGAVCEHHSGFNERIRGNTKRIGKLDQNYSDLQDMILKIYRALIVAAFSFAVAAVMLGINLAIR